MSGRHMHIYLHTLYKWLHTLLGDPTSEKVPFLPEVMMSNKYCTKIKQVEAQSQIWKTHYFIRIHTLTLLEFHF